jgi:hypothetical protein
VVRCQQLTFARSDLEGGSLSERIEIIDGSLSLVRIQVNRHISFDQELLLEEGVAVPIAVTPIESKAEVVHIRLRVLALLLSAYPAIAFIRGPLRRWHRKRKGLCLDCGYALIGNVIGACHKCSDTKRTVIRRDIVIVLTLAVLATVAMSLLSFWAMEQPYWPGVGNGRGNLKLGWRLLAHPGYVAHVNFLRNNLHISLLSNYCCLCGELTPLHSESCYRFDSDDYSWGSPVPAKDAAVPGFSWRSYRGGPTDSDHIVIALWIPLILFAIYPTIAFIRGPLRRWRRRRKGLCVACGYDLTGNVSGVCPECGTEVKSP